jgi:hypothetical protein
LDYSAGRSSTNFYFEGRGIAAIFSMRSLESEVLVTSIILHMLWSTSTLTSLFLPSLNPSRNSMSFPRLGSADARYSLIF